MYVCVGLVYDCVCVCVCARSERESEKERGGQEIGRDQVIQIKGWEDAREEKR